MPLKFKKPASNIAMFVLLVLFGLVGNYLKFPLFLNVEFIFGSIFAMVAMQIFGFGPGILAGALIASYTISLWNHPYYFLIASMELVAVGILFHRYRIGLVLADALFWIALGLPLVYLSYHGVMGVSPTNTSLVMSKSALNGIVNALVARVLYTWIALRLRGVLLEYRDITYNFLAVFALLPAISLLVIQGRADFAETESHIRSELRADGQHLSAGLNVWLKNRTTAVVHLATMAARRSPTQMQDALEQSHASDINYERIALIDRDAISVALSPPVDELGKTTLGRSYADRPYIPMLRQTLKPMLSVVVLSKASVTHKPIVLVLAPVIVHDAYAGYVAGVLSLDQVQASFQENAALGNLRYTLLDKGGNIIMTNVPGQTPMTPLHREAGGVLSPMGDGFSQWVPAVSAGAPIMERWKSSFYVSETPLGQTKEWTLVLERPAAPFQNALLSRYATSLGFLLLIVFVALALAELSSRHSIRSLVELSLMTEALPSRLMVSGDAIAWPTTRVAETTKLIVNFKDMAHSLGSQFSAVKRDNESLESRVQERTIALEMSLKDRDALLKEVHHRVKNNLQVISSLLSMEARRSNSATTKGVLGEMKGRIYAMAQLHESLYRSGTYAAVDLGFYLADIVTKAFQSQQTSNQQVRLRLHMGSIPAGMDQAIACGLLVNELVSNCMKHGFPAEHSGEVLVELQAIEANGVLKDTLWRLSVSDTGVGLPSDFNERRKSSLGLQLVEDLSQQLGGVLEIAPRSGAGAVFVVVFKVLEIDPLVMPL